MVEGSRVSFWALFYGVHRGFCTVCRVAQFCLNSGLYRIS